ncbi:hypothetical protein D9758_013626 [Tetrapyrgos nigripes]|uniref:Uncharacterized protein n=1 Tax=Tetrapyrgos nigripes TaxID=182062 RepID=A0A8H5CPV9_9AGAR|nr:hypothetical protein D9758_013626 [Tetrapyrgos nigripes]
MDANMDADNLIIPPSSRLEQVVIPCLNSRSTLPRVNQRLYNFQRIKLRHKLFLHIRKDLGHSPPSRSRRPQFTVQGESQLIRGPYPDDDVERQNQYGHDIPPRSRKNYYPYAGADIAESISESIQSRSRYAYGGPGDEQDLDSMSYEHGQGGYGSGNGKPQAF